MTDRRTLPLPSPYTDLNTAETINPDTGRVTYRFRAPRAAGTTVIGPEFRGEDSPIPTLIYAQFGDDAYNDNDRADRPVINGVTITGGIILNPTEYLARPDGGYIGLRRSIDRWTNTSAPVATSRYGSAIIRTLLTAWHERPDRDDLIHAAARHAAPRRLAELRRHTIDPIKAQIDKLSDQLVDHYALAGQLTRLAAEYEATRTDPQHPDPERTPSWHRPTPPPRPPDTLTGVRQPPAARPPAAVGRLAVRPPHHRRIPSPAQVRRPPSPAPEPARTP
ncbi:hypothetical protein QTQ03_28485 [Micromonospora sp. WMMA1363]|uniref:hypothetical protein n=1 Tax=Micromonospora sp. WMMA1363 TaxID=3053985 RepID=UPI00259C8712|nr:hypothetical protein [Micromonospora sp. WMMA1363]MDM4723345.1 hypothetical protein [Micromonospora sp. WMMA1363]